MRETIKKSLDETINKSAVKETPVDDDTSTDKHADKGASKNGEEAAPVDTSKFIIEANRIYEQGNYGRAATLYGKGMDKSASFKNEDFVVYRLGDCRFRTGKYEEALKTFQSLNSEYVNSPFRFKSLLKTGECYAAMGDLKKPEKRSTPSSHKKEIVLRQKINQSSRTLISKLRIITWKKASSFA